MFRLCKAVEFYVVFKDAGWFLTRVDWAGGVNRIRVISYCILSFNDSNRSMSVGLLENDITVCKYVASNLKAVKGYTRGGR